MIWVFVVDTFTSSVIKVRNKVWILRSNKSLFESQFLMRISYILKIKSFCQHWFQIVQLIILVFIHVHILKLFMKLRFLEKVQFLFFYFWLNFGALSLWALLNPTRLHDLTICLLGAFGEYMTLVLDVFAL